MEKTTIKYSSTLVEEVDEEKDGILRLDEGRMRQPSTCCSTRILPTLMGCLLAASIVAATILSFHARPKTRPKLEFTSRRRSSDNSSSGSTASRFKILQLADLHLGEAEATDWGPEQDRKTWIVLERVIHKEDPDLIVLSGDQLTGNNVHDNATAYYHLLGTHLSEFQHPWALIFGNHDDAPLERRLENGTMEYIPAKTSREMLLQTDQSFPLSLTSSTDTKNKQHPLFGTSNYVLPVSRKGEVVAQILFLDTGGGSLPEKVEQSQIDFIAEQTSSGVATFVFAHIPTQEFVYNDSCSSPALHDDGVAAVESDAGFVDALVASGAVKVLAVGHNHGNDYCCQRSDVLHLCFGRHSAYGGYGRWDRGARVYELSIMDESSSVSWKSWVRMENGTVVDEYEPFGRG